MRTVDILPEHVRPGARLHDEGVSVGTINADKAIFSVVFTTAPNDQMTFVHPCKAPLSIRGRLPAVKRAPEVPRFCEGLPDVSHERGPDMTQARAEGSGLR